MKLRRYTCRHVRNLLPLHVGGDLLLRQAGPVEAHLHTCLTCFREYRELTAMRERIGVLTEQPLPEGVLDGFADEIMARIAIGEPGPRAELPTAMERARMWPRYAAAAGLLIAFGFGMHTLGAWSATPVAMPQSDTHAMTAVTEHESAEVAMTDDLGIFPPPVDDLSQRTLLRPPVFEPNRGAGDALVSESRGQVMPGTRPGAVPSFSEGARVLVDAAGSRILLVLPQQGGGLQQEYGRELRPREP